MDVSFSFSGYPDPFPHLYNPDLIDTATLDAVNAEWPGPEDPRWIHEAGKRSTKSALLFPNTLPATAQALAERLYSPEACEAFSRFLGLPLQPDPWFLEGDLSRSLGGGLHEIHPGGFLKTHVDFEQHPSGLVRAANLLVYLNKTWNPKWGGGLLLGRPDRGEHFRIIQPFGCSAVLFRTTRDSWHGHPEPLACPEGTTRRSLALYYYTAKGTKKPQRPTTIYADKPPSNYR